MPHSKTQPKKFLLNKQIEKTSTVIKYYLPINLNYFSKSLLQKPLVETIDDIIEYQELLHLCIKVIFEIQPLQEQIFINSFILPMSIDAD